MKDVILIHLYGLIQMTSSVDEKHSLPVNPKTIIDFGFEFKTLSTKQTNRKTSATFDPIKLFEALPHVEYDGKTQLKIKDDIGTSLTLYTATNRVSCVSTLLSSEEYVEFVYDRFTKLMKAYGFPLTLTDPMIHSVTRTWCIPNTLFALDSIAEKLPSTLWSYNICAAPNSRLTVAELNSTPKHTYTLTKKGTLTVKGRTVNAVDASATRFLNICMPYSRSTLMF